MTRIRRAEHQEQKRVRREPTGRVRKLPFEDRIAPVLDGPAVVASGYGQKLMGKYLVGQVVARDEQWAVVQFPDRGDGAFKEAYSVLNGRRRGDTEVRGWRIDVRELDEEKPSPVNVQSKHENDTIELLQRERYPYNDGTENLVFEVWRHKHSQEPYFQAFRETIPEDGKRIRRKPCAIPFWVLKNAVTTFGGPD